MKQAVAAFLCVALAGCASSSVLVGTQRPEMEPDQVKLYLQPPAQYEQVGLLEASSNGAFALTNRQKTNKVVERLKEEAAALGANGILLQGIGNEVGGAIGGNTGTVYGSSYTGMGYAVPVMNKAGSAIAIYVPAGGEAVTAPVVAPAAVGTPPPVLPVAPPPLAPAASSEGCVACAKIRADHE